MASIALVGSRFIQSSRSVPLLASKYSSVLTTFVRLESTTRISPNRSFRNFQTSPAMSSGYSNTNTGSNPADPYVQKALENPSIREKIEDLVTFADKCKFCMMTTEMGKDGMMASRCMALAGKV